MNTIELFNSLRKLNGSLSQIQVDSINAILDACNKHLVTDEHQIAYILATAYHEARLKPVREIGLGKGHKYGQNIKQNGLKYLNPKQIYYGRGLIQLTWYENYLQFGLVIGIDLLNNPDLALQPDYAAEIIVIGMKKGMFTGISLGHYFSKLANDPINARRIINGVDCAELIAGYYKAILAGITHI
jgi:predicted chitinase